MSNDDLVVVHYETLGGSAETLQRMAAQLTDTMQTMVSRFNAMTFEGAAAAAFEDFRVEWQRYGYQLDQDFRFNFTFLDKAGQTHRAADISAAKNFM